MNYATIKSLLQGNEDKVFTVEFVKKDGSLRKMNARLGVKKGVKGTGRSNTEIAHLLTAYDMQKGAFRTINCDTVKSIKMQGASINL